MGVRVPLGIHKGAPRGTGLFTCLQWNFLHVFSGILKHNNYIYISNYCAHDYSQRVLDRKNTARRVITKKVENYLTKASARRTLGKRTQRKIQKRFWLKSAKKQLAYFLRTVPKSKYGCLCTQNPEFERHLPKHITCLREMRSRKLVRSRHGWEKVQQLSCSGETTFPIGVKDRPR